MLTLGLFLVVVVMEGGGACLSTSHCSQGWDFRNGMELAGIIKDKDCEQGNGKIQFDRSCSVNAELF